MSKTATEVEMIEVEIVAREVVRHHTYTKMPKPEYEKYLAMCDREASDYEFSHAFADYIKFDTGMYGDDITDLEIELRT